MKKLLTTLVALAVVVLMAFPFALAVTYNDPGITTEDPIDLQFPWDVNALVTGSSGTYDLNLAIGAGALCTAVESGTNTAESVLEDLGLAGSVSHYGYGSDATTLAHTFSRKTITVDGSSYHLITIVGRGTMSAADITTDTTPGAFSENANAVLSNLDTFLAAEGLSLTDRANRFFVTGHSLGGAVANIVAHRLAQNGVDRSAIYGYTYGTPWTANRSDADARADNNIFNFIGGSTMLSEAFDNFCWGSDETYSNMSGGSFDYTEFMRKCRYGTDKTFDNQNDAFKAAYRTLTGNEYDPDGTLAKHLVSTYLGYILADQSVSATVENGVRTVTINGGALPTEPDPEPEPMTAELVSSEGTDLEAKTNTLLQVNMQNADPADYTFKFIVYNTTTNQWYKLKDFGPETEYNWYTGPAGVKNLYVDIKDADGEMTRISLTGVNVTDNGVKVDTFTSSEGDVLPAKSYTTLTAAAKDGTAPYTYKFIVHNNDNDQWYRIRDFGDAPTCEWYTGPAGNKTLYVDIKDSTGQVVRGPLNVTVQ